MTAVRTLLAAALFGAALGASGTPSPVLKVAVQRTTYDLLASLPIAVVVDNPAAITQPLHFPQPAEYSIEVRDRSGTLVWSSQTPVTTPAVPFPAHTRALLPGTTTLAVYDWNALTSGGWSPEAGTYSVTVRLLSSENVPDARAQVRFDPPLSPASVASMRVGDEFTVAGTLSDTRDAIADDRGSATLSHKLLTALPRTRIVVRGFASALRGGTRFFMVERWAPLGQPVKPS